MLPGDPGWAHYIHFSSRVGRDQGVAKCEREYELDEL